MEFDNPEFLVEEVSGFKLLVRAIRLLTPHEPLPADVIFRSWAHGQGQVCLIFISVNILE